MVREWGLTLAETELGRLWGATACWGEKSHGGPVERDLSQREEQESGPWVPRMLSACSYTLKHGEHVGEALGGRRQEAW